MSDLEAVKQKGYVDGWMGIRNLNDGGTNPLVCVARGFDKGLPLEWDQEECDRRSPGIIEAQNKARLSCLTLLPIRVRTDEDGNLSLQIVKTQNFKEIEVVDEF
jgi:hypothetical protein